MNALEPIRLATQEEVEAIAAESDLGPGCMVLKYGPITGVVRNVMELDPVFYGDAKNSQKLYFVSNVETWMRLNGLPFYYFNVPATEEFEEYREIVKRTGAKQTSREPEIRFKKAL